jgi:hypothetical protein
MYLVHYPIMLATRIALRPLGLHPWAGYLLTLATGGMLSWLIHDRIVARSRWLALLMNGRLPPRLHIEIGRPEPVPVRP